jgi:RNA polymerase sigma factor (sigma-70 family)
MHLPSRSPESFDRANSRGLGSMTLLIEESTKSPSVVFQELRPRILAYAKRITGPELAEDVAQEVFLRLFTYKGANLGGITFAFVLTMTRNVALTMLKKQSRTEVVLKDVSVRRREMTAPAADALLASMGTRLAQDVASRLAELPPRQRDAFFLTEVCGLSEEQAARSLDMTRPAVNARRRAAIDKLKAGISDEDAGEVVIARTAPGGQSAQPRLKIANCA